MAVKGTSIGREITFQLNGANSDPDEVKVWFTKSGDVAGAPYVYGTDLELSKTGTGVYLFQLLSVPDAGQYKLEVFGEWTGATKWRQEYIETVAIGKTVADMVSA